jgi:hypothetical protein
MIKSTIDYLKNSKQIIKKYKMKKIILRDFDIMYLLSNVIDFKNINVYFF